jgi:hypothetical protein
VTTAIKNKRIVHIPLFDWVNQPMCQHLVIVTSCGCQFAVNLSLI